MQRWILSGWHNFAASSTYLITFSFWVHFRARAWKLRCGARRTLLKSQTRENGRYQKYRSMDRLCADPTAERISQNANRKEYQSNVTWTRRRNHEAWFRSEAASRTRANNRFSPPCATSMTLAPSDDPRGLRRITRTVT